MVLFGFLDARTIRFEWSICLPKQLSQFLGVVQSILIDRMPTFANSPIASPVPQRILRHAEELGCLLNGHEFTQFRHRNFPQ